MKPLRRLALPLFLLLTLLSRPAAALTGHVLSSGNSGANMTSAPIDEFYQNFFLPKFPAAESTASGFAAQFQISFIQNNGPYNFVYFHIVREKAATFPTVHPERYRIEVSYQVIDGSGFHDEFLLDYGYPGDSILWQYNDNGATNAAQIVSDGRSGHSGWSHSGSWAWPVGQHPNVYVNPTVTYVVATTIGTFGPECVSDMPAQDTPGSSSHVTTWNTLTFVIVAGVKTDLLFLPMTPDTGVVPTSCAFTVVPQTIGAYTISVVTTYGGG